MDKSAASAEKTAGVERQPACRGRSSPKRSKLAGASEMIEFSAPSLNGELISKESRVVKGDSFAIVFTHAQLPPPVNNRDLFHGTKSNG